MRAFIILNDEKFSFTVNNISYERFNSGNVILLVMIAVLYLS